MVLGALDDAGGQRYLAQQAIDNPGPFLALLGKILPAHIVSPEGSHLHFHLEAAMRVSQEMQAAPKRVVTIEQEAQTAPSDSLLDAPLPEE